MKNLKLKIFSGAFILSAGLLASCNASNKDYSKIIDENSESSQIIESDTYTRLSAPSNISFDTESLTVSWDKVNGASSYEVVVNSNVMAKKITMTIKDKTSATISESKLSDVDLANDELLISIRAKGETNDSFSNYASYIYNPLATGSSSLFAYKLNDDGTSITINGVASSALPAQIKILNIPEKINGVAVTFIADGAFQDDRVIEEVNIPSTIIKIGNNAFKSSHIRTVTLAEGIETIGEYAFANATRLNSINIPSTLKEILNNAFDSSNLAQLAFDGQNNVEILGDYAFYGTKVGSYDLPSCVTYLGKYAFGKTQIVEMDLSNINNITNLPDGLFSNCKKLTNITIPSQILSIGESCFEADTVLKQVYLSDTNNVSKVGNLAFKGCTNLKYFGKLSSYDPNNSNPNIIIPREIESIGDSAFESLKIKEISFEENSNLYSIGASAFKANASITNISLPSSLKVIGDEAFGNCKTLENIDFASDSFEFIYKDAFKGTSFISSFGTDTIIIKNVLLKLGTDDAKIAEYIVPEQVTVISNNVFSKAERVTIKNITLNANITTIGDKAFYENSTLSEISIPSSVSKIGVSAFEECSKLKTVTFENQESSTLSEISEACFKNNNLLETINIPDSVTKIADYAFYFDADNESATTLVFKARLNDVTISENSNLKEIGSYAFRGQARLKNISLPSNLETIGIEAFSYNSSLENFIISQGNSITYVGDRAFLNSSIKGANFESCLDYLGNKAFYNAKSLESVTFDNGAFANFEDKMIYEETFAGCELLTSITLPENIKNIGYRAFGDCTNLLVVESSAIDTDVNAFENTAFESSFADGFIIYNDKLLKYNGTETNITLNDDIKIIGKNAFKNSNITSINIVSSVEEIEENAFEGSSKLESITFASEPNLLSIGDNAFYNCTSLKEIIIPSSLTYLGKNVFKNNYLLESVIFETSSLEIINESAFENCNSLTTLELSNGIKQISQYAFARTQLSSVNLPSSIEQIQDYAFYNIGKAANYLIDPELWLIEASLNSLSFADDSNICYIGKYAFANNILDSIDLPTTNPITLDEYCFANSKNIESLKLDNNLIITEGIIYGSNNLKTLEMPSNITVARLFGGRINDVSLSLETITILDGSLSIPDNAFTGLGMVKNINLPNTITSIGSYAFYGCRNLNNLDISSVNYIGSYAFNGCLSLENIVFGDSISYIGNKAFESSLYETNKRNEQFVIINNILVKYNGENTKVTIPENVIAIAGGSFAGNGTIEEIQLAKTTNKLYNGAFDSCYSLSLIKSEYEGLVQIELEIFDTIDTNTFSFDANNSYKDLYKEDLYWFLYSNYIK